MLFSKENKKQFYEWSVKLLKKLNIEDKSLGFAIKAIHFNIPAFLMLFMVYGSKTLNIFIILYLLSILGLFYLFDGCFLTKIEKEIDGEDLTIIDPLLEFCNIDKTHENRFRISIYIFFTYFSIILFVFYLRFYSSYESTIFFDNYFDLIGYTFKYYVLSMFTSSKEENQIIQYQTSTV